MNCVAYLRVKDLFCTRTLALHPELAPAPFWVGHRGVVLACSSDLERFGVRRGMPERQARRIYPAAQAVPYRPEEYQEISDTLCNIAYRLSPVVEPFRPGEIFLDLPLGGWEQAAATLAAEVRDMGYDPVVAVTHSRLTGRLLGMRPGRTVERLERDRHPEFMASLPVRALWTVPARTRQRLVRAGLFQIADVQRIHRQPLARKLGSADAALVFEAARGFDLRPLQAAWPPAARSVRLSFHSLDNRETLKARLRDLAGMLARQLAEGHEQCRRVRLEIREEGVLFGTQDVMLLDPPASGVNRLYLAAVRLLGQMHLRRPVESVILTAEEISTAAAKQGDLFSPLRMIDHQKEEFKAFLALRFGAETLRFCSESQTPWREQMLEYYT